MSKQTSPHPCNLTHAESHSNHLNKLKNVYNSKKRITSFLVVASTVSAIVKKTQPFTTVKRNKATSHKNHSNNGIDYTPIKIYDPELVAAKIKVSKTFCIGRFLSR